jgi:hypothetical protein
MTRYTVGPGQMSISFLVPVDGYTVGTAPLDGLNFSVSAVPLRC